MKILLLLLTIFGFGDGGASAGRKGNDAYQNGRHAEAQRYYQEGLRGLQSSSGHTASALQNNLGATYFRQKNFQKAEETFLQAAQQANAIADLGRAYYNAGNAALMQQNNEKALSHWQKALLANPQDQAARFNYELLRRMMQDNQDNKSEQEKSREDKREEEKSKEDKDNQEKPKDDKGKEKDDKKNQEKPKDDKGKGKDKNKEQSRQKPEGGDGKKPRPQIEQNEANQILNAQSADERDLLQQVRRRPFKQRVVEQDW